MGGKQGWELHPLVVWVGLLLAGVWCNATVPQSLSLWVVVACLSSALALLRGWGGGKGWLFLLALAAFSTGASLEAGERSTRLHHDRLLQDGVVGKRLYFQGRVVGAPSGSGNSLRVPFLLLRWAKVPSGRWKRTYGKIRLTLTGRLLLLPGEILRVRLKLRRPRRYANPGQSNPWERVARQGIRFQGSCSLRYVLRLGMRPTSWRGWLETKRYQWARWMDKQLSSPAAAGLLKALLLGNREGVSQSTKVAFARTGTSHLLAISGLHLALVCSMVFGAIRWLLLRWTVVALRFDTQALAALVTFPVALGYTLLSGGAISTQRALLMISVVLLGLWLQRKATIGTTLAFAALLLTLWQPSASFELSFQLSFLAVIVLVWGASQFSVASDTAWWRKGLAWMGGLLWASVVATLGTLPLTLVFFAEIPILAPLVNLVAVPLGGYLVVGLGLISLGIATLFPPLGSLLLKASGFFAEVLLRLVSGSASLSWLNPTLPPLRVGEVVAWYALFGGFLLWRRSRRLGLVCFVLVPLGWGVSCVSHRPAKQLEIAFLDIGQGDCALVRFPNGHTMLVDAGGEPFARFDTGQRVVLPYLRWRRIKRLDTVVMSHPHPDHFGGFPSVMNALPVGEFWHTGEKGGHPQFRALQKILKQKQIRQRLFPKPTTLWIGGVKVDILHPFPGAYEGKTYYWALGANDNSLVLRLTYGKHRILLLGDVEERAEELMVQRYKSLRADVIKVAHHGSRTSSTALFLDAVRPRHAVISLGRRNIFGFPHPQVKKRFQRRKIRVWRTDKMGRILLRSDGRKLTFSTHLSPSR